MKVTRTPDGIPVIEVTSVDLAGPEPAAMTAALDQLAAEAMRRFEESLKPTE